MAFAPHITIGAKSADRCISSHMHWDEAKRRVVIVDRIAVGDLGCEIAAASRRGRLGTAAGA